MRTETTKLTVTVSKTTDLALRAFLGNRGAKKGDLSKFIEEAVNWRMFNATRKKVHDAFADTSGDEVDALADEAVTAARQDPAHPPPRQGA